MKKQRLIIVEDCSLCARPIILSEEKNREYEDRIGNVTNPKYTKSLYANVIICHFCKRLEYRYGWFWFNDVERVMNAK